MLFEKRFWPGWIDLDDEVFEQKVCYSADRVRACCESSPMT
jgi:hypothetical protein